MPAKGWITQRRHKGLIILASMVIFPIDSPILRKAGELIRHLDLKVADAIITATVLFKDYTLVTKNIRDFQKIQNLKVLSP